MQAFEYDNHQGRIEQHSINDTLSTVVCTKQGKYRGGHHHSYRQYVENQSG